MIALRDDRVDLTRSEVTEILHRIGNGLQSMYLGPERRVAVFAENSAETLLAYAGVLLAGCSVVPVGFHLGVDEVTYILRDSEAGLVLAGPETVDRARAAGKDAGVDAVIAWRATDLGAAGGGGWEQWLAEQPETEPDRTVAPRPALAYTSGTTGFPKGVTQPPNIFAGGDSIVEHLERLDADVFNGFERHLVIGPLYHAGPQSAVRALAVGRFVSVLGRFDPIATLQAIERDRAELVVMVPTHFKRLLALPDDVRASFDTSSLQLVAHTGSACPVTVKAAMIDWFGPVLFEAYGATECGTVTAISSPDWLAHPGSVGRAVAPLEVLVLDDDAVPVPAGTEGNVFVHDPTKRGIVYHHDADKTADAHIAPGTFTLGEVGYLDSEGYLFLTDRVSDMVISGGVNIYPAEAERVLAEHEDVIDAAGIGVPDHDLGERLRMLVVLREGAVVTSEELIAFCRGRLAHYKCPTEVAFIDDIPRDAMGKVPKRRIRAELGAG
jgi:long-chain acyl-CoA synthetase